MGFSQACAAAWMDVDKADRQLVRHEWTRRFMMIGTEIETDQKAREASESNNRRQTLLLSCLLPMASSS